MQLILYIIESKIMRLKINVCLKRDRVTPFESRVAIVTNATLSGIDSEEMVHNCYEMILSFDLLLNPS